MLVPHPVRYPKCPQAKRRMGKRTDRTEPASHRNKVASRRARQFHRDGGAVGGTGLLVFHFT